jgi:hypothetical protein
VLELRKEVFAMRLSSAKPATADDVAFWGCFASAQAVGPDKLFGWLLLVGAIVILAISIYIERRDQRN